LTGDGKTGIVEPNWSTVTTIGQEITESHGIGEGGSPTAGSVTWRCVGPQFHSSETANGNTIWEFRELGTRIKRTNVVPAGGRFAVGDRIMNTTPLAGGGANPIGWVCTTAGLAGSTAVFKSFGADIAS
jgi:hypothetical protein